MTEKRRRAEKREGPIFVMTTSLPPGMSDKEARERVLQAMRDLAQGASSQRGYHGSSP